MVPKQKGRRSRPSGKSRPEREEALRAGVRKEMLAVLEAQFPKVADRDWFGAWPLARDPPHAVIGTADIGKRSWCAAKAAFSQWRMEAGHARRVIEICRHHRSPVSFLRPHGRPTRCRYPRPTEEPR